MVVSRRGRLGIEFPAQINPTVNFELKKLNMHIVSLCENRCATHGNSDTNSNCMGGGLDANLQEHCMLLYASGTNEAELPQRISTAFAANYFSFFQSIQREADLGKRTFLLLCL